MKKLFLLLLFVFSPLFSQDDDLDQLPFDDEPLKKQRINYFAIGGGYTVGTLRLNLDDYNSLLGQFSGRNELGKNLIMHGGAAFTGIPFIKNFRLGYHSYGGGLSDDYLIGESNVSQELRVSLSGINADYGYVLFKNFAIMGGFGLGWGNVNMRVAKGNATYDWNMIKDDLSDADNYFIFAEKKFMYFNPTLSFEWATTNFLMFRALINYNYTFNNPIASAEDKSWSINNVAQINNAPRGLTPNGLYFEFGVFLGLFNY
jgi:hypothetical protein